MRTKISHLPACIVMLVLISGGATSTTANDAPEKAATCAACHGADGNSINPEWPNLAGQHASYTTQQIKWFKEGVRENASMAPMVANLNEEDIQALGEYFAKLPPKIGTIAAGDIAAGETLYRGGNQGTGVPACMACHGPNGAGNAPAKYPALRGQHATYTANQLKAYKAGTRSGDAKGIMRTIAEKMSDQEIESVAKYINALY